MAITVMVWVSLLLRTLLLDLKNIHTYLPTNLPTNRTERLSTNSCANNRIANWTNLTWEVNWPSMFFMCNKKNVSDLGHQQLYSFWRNESDTERVVEIKQLGRCVRPRAMIAKSDRYRETCHDNERRQEPPCSYRFIEN